jgi:hypothetical protein
MVHERRLRILLEQLQPARRTARSTHVGQRAEHVALAGAPVPTWSTLGAV